MEPFRALFEFLNKFLPLSEEEFQSFVLPYVESRTVNKKQVLTETGKVEQYLNFINKGLVRKYFLREGEEFITQVSYEGQVIHSQESFYSQTASEYFIETIEPGTLLSFSYNNLEAMFSANAKMERLGRKIVTYIMVVMDRWQMQLLKLSARDRFLYFVQHNPVLLQRTPQKYLASLLNIQPETFSRFKHLIKTK